MLGKTSKPVIEILTGSLVSGNISGLLEFATSPRSHVESPKALKKSFDLGGVGLGIVTTLENPDSKALFGRNLGRSTPIPVQNSPRKGEEVAESGSLEEYYTVVTCHRPNNKSYMKVYPGDDHRPPFRIQKSSQPSVFHISPVGSGEVTGVPPPDFLSSCSLCDKNLYGKDIYMYRGERGFCSAECRYKQIVNDERKEKCRSEATRMMAVAVAMAEVSGSPYTAANNGQILTTGILAI